MSNILKVVVTGGSDFGNYALLAHKLDRILANKIAEGWQVIIISGGASGADTLGEWYAREHKLPIERFLPDWKKNGKGAGYVRNEQMAEYADAIVAFWDGKSRGTENMINNMLRLRKLTRIVRYDRYR